MLRIKGTLGFKRNVFALQLKAIGPPRGSRARGLTLVLFKHHSVEEGPPSPRATGSAQPSAGGGKRSLRKQRSVTETHPFTPSCEATGTISPMNASEEKIAVRLGPMRRVQLHWGDSRQQQCRRCESLADEKGQLSGL